MTLLDHLPSFQNPLIIIVCKFIAVGFSRRMIDKEEVGFSQKSACKADLNWIRASI
jgi:hypothetical protein